MYINIYQLFNKIKKDGKTIVLIWVSSYKDIYGNTMADIKAKAA